jgi:hypothetical protein
MSRYAPYPPPPQGYYLPPVGIVQQRPGIVTAIGVTSIIIACLSVIAGLISGTMVYARYTIGAQAANQARSKTMSATPGGIGGPTGSALPTPGDLEKENKFERAALEFRRDALVNLFNSLQEMTPQQQQHLAAMLGTYGNRLLPAEVLEAPALSPSDLKEWITRSGTLKPLRADDPDPVYFDLKSGRLEIYADTAVFRPADSPQRLRAFASAGALPVSGLRTRAKPNAASRPTLSSTTAPSTLYPSGLTEAEVVQALTNIQTAFQGQAQQPLNAAQMATLRQLLQNSSPPIVNSGSLYAPLSIGATDPDGSARMRLSNAFIVIDRSGAVTTHISMSMHHVVLDPVVGVLLIGEFVASELLAVFLFVSGILVLRGSTRGAGLHWIYALLKLPIAILSGVALVWGVTEVINGIGRMGQAADPEALGRVTTIGIVVASISAIYPVILMLVLSTRTVRDHYAAERARQA